MPDAVVMFSLTVNNAPELGFEDIETHLPTSLISLYAFGSGSMRCVLNRLLLEVLALCTCAQMKIDFENHFRRHTTSHESER